jgi:hypothetical protein
MFMEEGYELARFDMIVQSAVLKMEDIKGPTAEFIMIDNQKRVLPPLVEGAEGDAPPAAAPADTANSPTGGFPVNAPY